MIIRADVKCYYCGHVSGHVEGDPHDPRARWRYQPAREFTSRIVPVRASIRCVRCGGPVFLDEIEAVRPRPCSMDEPLATAAK